MKWLFHVQIFPFFFRLMANLKIELTTPSDLHPLTFTLLVILPRVVSEERGVKSGHVHLYQIYPGLFVHSSSPDWSINHCARCWSAHFGAFIDIICKCVRACVWTLYRPHAGWPWVCWVNNNVQFSLLRFCRSTCNAHICLCTFGEIRKYTFWQRMIMQRSIVVSVSIQHKNEQLWFFSTLFFVHIEQMRYNQLSLELMVGRWFFTCTLSQASHLPLLPVFVLS